MQVRVRLFAILRERAGRSEVELELPDAARVDDALAALADVTGGLKVVMAVNREYVTGDTRLRAGDELALIPPVSGGSEYASVRAEPLSMDALVAHVRDARAGAVVVFSGVTRDVAALEYEVYEPMARERIAAIVSEAVVRHGLCAAACEHRVGVVELSEPSVIVAASAPHRPEAFAGAREIIDRVKAEAPIWKKEGTEWVEGTAPPAR
jgi:MoaE-MoaD fusion protein